MSSGDESRVFTKRVGRLWKQHPAGGPTYPPPKKMWEVNLERKRLGKKLMSEKPQRQELPKQKTKIDPYRPDNFWATHHEKRVLSNQVRKIIQEDEGELEILKRENLAPDRQEQLRANIRQNMKFELQELRILKAMGGDDFEQRKKALHNLTKVDNEYASFSKDKTFGDRYPFGPGTGTITTRLEVEYTDKDGVIQPKIEDIHENGWGGSTDESLFNTWFNDGKSFNGTVFQSDAEGHDLNLPFPNVAPGLKHYLLETIANPYGGDETHIRGRVGNMYNHPNDITIHVFANHLANIDHVKYSDYTTDGQLNEQGSQARAMLAATKYPIQPGRLQPFLQTKTQTQTYMLGISRFNKEIASNKIPGHQTQHIYSMRVRDRKAVTKKLTEKLFEHLPQDVRQKYDLEWGGMHHNLEAKNSTPEKITKAKTLLDYNRMIGSGGRDSLMHYTDGGRPIIDLAFESLDAGGDFEITKIHIPNPNINTFTHTDLEITDHHPIDRPPPEPADGAAWAGGGGE